MNLTLYNDVLPLSLFMSLSLHLTHLLSLDLSMFHRSFCHIFLPIIYPTVLLLVETTIVISVCPFRIV